VSQTDFRVVRRCSLNDDQSRQDESGSLCRIATLRGLLIHGLTTVLLAAAAAGDPPGSESSCHIYEDGQRHLR
jgi:hypothetical protein